MDFRQLRTFIEVVQIGSLSGASDRLRIAQSALSRQIRLLEAELGLELFIRHGRGMRVTEAGRSLAERLSGLMQQFDGAIEEARSHGGRIRGEVALGLMPTTSVLLASSLALRVKREMPDLRLRIVEGYAGHLIDWVQRGEIDLTLLYGPGTDYHLQVTELLHEELVVIGPAAALGSGRMLSLAEVAALPLVVPSRPHGLRLVLDTAVERRGLQLNIAFEADSYRVLLDLVAAGMGYTVLPLSPLLEELGPRGLGHARIEGAPVQREIVLACQSIRAEAKAVQAVSELILDEIAAMVAEGSWPAYPAEPLRQRRASKPQPARAASAAK